MLYFPSESGDFLAIPYKILISFLKVARISLRKGYVLYYRHSTIQLIPHLGSILCCSSEQRNVIDFRIRPLR